MKKTLKITFSAILMFICLFAFVSCGETNHYTIIFETNGGTELESQRIEKGTTLEIGTTTKEGYTLVGWFIDEALTTEFDSSLPIEKSMTIYAKWAKNVTTFIITFETGEGSSVESQIVAEGGFVQTPSRPTLDGYSFAGWYLDSEFNKPFYFQTPVTSSFTLYAKWTLDTVYHTVTFVYNNGQPNSEVNVEEGEHLSELPTPTYTNYVFKGWFIDSQLANEFSIETAITEATTLYAKWAERVENRVLSIAKPEAIVLYEQAKKGSENKETEFVNLKRPYYVGDDNGYVCLPSTSFISVNFVKQSTTPTTVDSWEYDIYVYYDGSNVNESSYIESIDNTTCTIDFSESAVGKSFEIKIIPTGLSTSQKENISNYTILFQVKVVDGYNAYDAVDLSVICDTARTGSDAERVPGKNIDAAWANFKTLHGIDPTIRPNSVILHSNMNVTTEVIPSEYLLDSTYVTDSDSDKEEALGSFVDYESIYMRKLNANEKFSLYGNYFTIDASQIPLVAREGDVYNVHGAGETVISHAQLFRFITRDDKENNKDGNNTFSYVNLSDFRVIGNAPKGENLTGCGGLIILKSSGPSTRCENMISARAFITYMYEYYQLANQYISNCKSYDAYNCFIYNWGLTLEVTNSEFIGCGGPVLIQDHVKKSQYNGGFVSYTTMTNCNAHSFVAGTEMWFASVGATAIVPQIKQLDAIFNQVGKSFLYTDKNEQTRTFMDLVAVNKDGAAQTFTQSQVEGSMTFDGYTFNYGKGKPYYQDILNLTFGFGAPSFEFETDLLTYFDGSNLYDWTHTPISQTNPNLQKILDASYITIYHMGMAITLRLGSVGQTH